MMQIVRKMCQVLTNTHGQTQNGDFNSNNTNKPITTQSYPLPSTSKNGATPPAVFSDRPASFHTQRNMFHTGRYLKLLIVKDTCYHARRMAHYFSPEPAFMRHRPFIFSHPQPSGVSPSGVCPPFTIVAQPTMRRLVCHVPTNGPPRDRTGT